MAEDRERYKELGDFLKTRRKRLTPEQVGLPKGQRRRTLGLRREELAQLAGICVTWYTYLEQGRPIRVSIQVLESLARILQLNEEERTYLFLLAHQQPPPVLPCSTLNSPSTILRAGSLGETVSPTLLRMLENMEGCPAYISDQRFNILAWNQLASIIFGDFSHKSGRERNKVWLMFTQPDYRKLYINWERQAKLTIAQFRAVYGQNIGNEWYKKFVEDLMQISPEFKKWWNDHDVQGIVDGNDEFNHPKAGYMKLDYMSFGVAGNTNLTLKVFTPTPNTDSMAKIKQLLQEDYYSTMMFGEIMPAMNSNLSDISSV